MTEPPSKKIKSGQEFMQTISECYDLKFNSDKRSEQQLQDLNEGLTRIRDTLESIKSSSDVPLGNNRTLAKINWAKCMSLLLEDGPKSARAIKVLVGRLSPGGGLL